MGFGLAAVHMAECIHIKYCQYAHVTASALINEHQYYGVFEELLHCA